MLKSLVIIGALATSTLLAVLYCSPQILSYYLAQDALRNEPAVELVPKQMEVLAPADTVGTTLSLYGHSVEVPWRGVAKTDEHQSLTRVQFASGQVLVFFDPSSAKGMKDTFREATGMSEGDVVRFLGESAETNYGLARMTLLFQPSRVSLFSTRQTAARNNVLTLMKRLTAKEASTGVFEVKLEGFRGFQKGDPASSRRVFLELFDERDRLFSIWLYSPDGAPPLTQAEVNRVMMTLK